MVTTWRQMFEISLFSLISTHTTMSKWYTNKHTQSHLTFPHRVWYTNTLTVTFTVTHIFQNRQTFIVCSAIRLNIFEQHTIILRSRWIIIHSLTRIPPPPLASLAASHSVSPSTERSTLTRRLAGLSERQSEGGGMMDHTPHSPG